MVVVIAAVPILMIGLLLYMAQRSDRPRENTLAAGSVGLALVAFPLLIAWPFGVLCAALAIAAGILAWRRGADVSWAAAGIVMGAIVLPLGVLLWASTPH